MYDKIQMKKKKKKIKPIESIENQEEDGPKKNKQTITTRTKTKSERC